METKILEVIDSPKKLEILYREMEISMAFTGHRDIQNVNRDILVKGTY